MNEYAREVFELRKKQAPWETEFLQSVEELFESIGSVIESDPRIKEYRILERLTIPERRRVKHFVSWDMKLYL